jgi:hypothetical protein
VKKLRRVFLMINKLKRGLVCGAMALATFAAGGVGPVFAEPKVNISEFIACGNNGAGEPRYRITVTLEGMDAEALQRWDGHVQLTFPASFTPKGIATAGNGQFEIQESGLLMTCDEATMTSIKNDKNGKIAFKFVTIVELDKELTDLTAVTCDLKWKN